MCLHIEKTEKQETTVAARYKHFLYRCNGSIMSAMLLVGRVLSSCFCLSGYFAGSVAALGKKWSY